VLKKLIPVVEQTADIGPGEQWNDGGHQHEVDQLVKNKIFKLAKFTLQWSDKTPPTVAKVPCL
jgi:hypothetical protein